MKILVECFGDNLLIEKLGYVRDDNHSSISHVAFRMKKKYLKERVLGIVDNDSEAVPNYFKQFVEIRKIHSVHFLKHRKQDKYLIRINKDFEEFFMRAENEARITPFFKSRSGLEDITKHEGINGNQKFIKHLENIIKKNPPSIAFLRSCINEAVKAK